MGLSKPVIKVTGKPDALLAFYNFHVRRVWGEAGYSYDLKYTWYDLQARWARFRGRRLVWSNPAGHVIRQWEAVQDYAAHGGFTCYLGSPDVTVSLRQFRELGHEVTVTED